MKVSGYVLLATGTLVVLVALFLLESTISTERMIDLSSYGRSIGSGAYDATYNLPKAQTREMTFLTGGLLMVVGAILVGAGAIVEQLQVRPIDAGDASAVASDAVAPTEALVAAPAEEPVEVAPNDDVKWLMWGAGWFVVLCLIAFLLVKAQQ